MSQVPQRKISFTAGQTFIDQALWCQGARVYKPVADILYGLPTQIRVLAHGIPTGIVIAVWFENMASKSFESNKPYFATAVDANNLTLLDHNTAGIAPAAFGSIYYVPPISTSGMTANASFKRTTSSSVLLSASSSGGSPIFTLPGNGIIRMELTPANTRVIFGSNKSPISGIAHVEVLTSTAQVFIPWIYSWECSPEGTV